MVDMNKWWESYICIAKKIETGGAGNDYSDINNMKVYVDEFAQYIPVDKYKRVLNLGAGAGGETKLLLDKGYDVVGITLGRDNVNMSKEKYGVDLVESDMHILDFLPNSFDSVFMVQTFEHFLSPFIACMEMWRVLRVGGLVYNDMPDPDDDDMWTIWHTNLMYPRQVKKIFELCGFKEIQDFSQRHRLRFIFEKLSTDKIDKWSYLKYIHELRNKA